VHGASYRPISISRIELEEGVGVGQVQEALVRSETGTERLIWYWYAVGGRFVADDLAAKVRQLYAGLWGESSGAVVALSVECGAECGPARRQLGDFARSMGPTLSGAVLRSASGP
jgi:EpsI family protein